MVFKIVLINRPLLNFSCFCSVIYELKFCFMVAKFHLKFNFCSITPVLLLEKLQLEYPIAAL